MDTRFWGPGAWRLLHSITFHAEPTAATTKFFETLPYILPCKYCRASLTDYYREDPIRGGGQAAPTSAPTSQEWLYRIHNRVNGKLRGQGLIATKNPTFAAVKRMYAAEVPSAAAFPAWDFLYSVAFNHPLYVKDSTPMPDIPDTVTAATATTEEQNRWNILPPRTRYMYWRRFWELLPAVLPPAWAAAWAAAAAQTSHPDFTKRRATLHWLWAIRCKFDRTSRDPYQEVCSRLAAHSSGCGAAKRAKTCRSRRRRAAAAAAKGQQPN